MPPCIMPPCGMNIMERAFAEEQSAPVNIIAAAAMPSAVDLKVPVMDASWLTRNELAPESLVKNTGHPVTIQLAQIENAPWMQSALFGLARIFRLSFAAPMRTRGLQSPLSRTFAGLNSNVGPRHTGEPIVSRTNRLPGLAQGQGCW